MRTPAIIGIVLIGVGAYLLFVGGSFTTRKDVLKVGDLKLTAKESHPIEPWLAGAAIAGGVVLVAAGVRRTS